MAILVKPVQRVNPQSPDEPKKWYVTQVTTMQVDETQVAMEIADETTLNPSEAMMALRQLRKIVLRHLLASESVKLGDWAGFNVTISSSASDTKDEVSARNLKSVNINLQVGDSFKAELKKASFAWIDKLAAGRTPTDEEEVPDTGGGGTDDDGNDDGEL